MVVEQRAIAGDDEALSPGLDVVLFEERELGVVSVSVVGAGTRQTERKGRMGSYSLGHDNEWSSIGLWWGEEEVSSESHFVDCAEGNTL